MAQIKKLQKFKNDPNVKMTQIQRWPKLKKYPNSKSPKLKNDPNLKTTQIKKRPKLKNY